MFPAALAPGLASADTARRDGDIRAARAISAYPGDPRTFTARLGTPGKQPCVDCAVA